MIYIINISAPVRTTFLSPVIPHGIYGEASARSAASKQRMRLSRSGAGQRTKNDRATIAPHENIVMVHIQ